MIFSPLMARRAACAPHPSDAALQRFLLNSLSSAATRPRRAIPWRRMKRPPRCSSTCQAWPASNSRSLIEGAQVQVKSVDGAPRQVQRTWELPTPIDAATSSARLEHGVLTLALARQAPGARAVELTVH